MTIPADDNAYSSDSRLTSVWPSKLCLRAVWTCWLWNRHDLDKKQHNEGWYDVVDTGIFTRLICMIIFLLCHQRNFPTADSSSSLRVLQSVCTVVLHLIRTNVSYLLPFCLVGLPSAVFTEWFQNKPTLDLSGIDVFRWQWVLYCYTARLPYLRVGNSTWPKLHANKVVFNCDSTNHRSQKHVTNMWWYYLFFITTLWPVRCRRKINPRKAMQSTLRV